jgi:predicted Holliday junction resolvase-like endonuclease
METNIFVTIVVIISIVVVACLLYYLRKPKTDLEIAQDKLNRGDKNIKKDYEITKKSQEVTDDFVKKQLKKTDEMLKK